MKRLIGQVARLTPAFVLLVCLACLSPPALSRWAN
jgi:hypothetical protein